MRFAPSSILALLVGLILASPAAAATKIAVVPFAPLTGDVPVRAGGKAAMLLAGELKNVGEVAPLELAIETDAKAAKALQEARDAVTAAQKLEARRKFGAAAAAYRQALERYEEAAPLVADVNEVSDAHVALAVVHYLTGDDEVGERELANAIALTPKRTFPGEETSKLFAATVARVREKLLAAPTATLQIESIPAGAQVLIDGREMGRTPLTLRAIPPGKHLWRVLLPTSEPVGGLVQLSPSEHVTAKAELHGSSPVTKLNALLATNSLSPAVAEAAKEAAATVEADLVAFGALLGRGDDLVLESFLYSPSQNIITRLPQKSFDSELISAGMELYNVAGDIGGRTQNLGTPEALPCKVSLEAPPLQAADRTEMAFKLPGDEVQETDEPKKSRRPVDPHKTIRVLRPRDK
ncbi:MAG: PEGA domain-containing protein [Myxococcales bacterium]|jgi:Skp family chaperone for outer membrane proteins